MSTNRPCKVAGSRRTRIGSPRAAARARQALFAPALFPGLEMTGKPFECGTREDRPQILLSDRCGRKLSVSRRGGEIDTDADDDKLQNLTLAELRLEEDSGYLATAQQYVVWPFVREPIEPFFEDRAQRGADSQRRDETKLRGLIYGTTRP